jgi:uncharacterized protein YxeA
MLVRQQFSTVFSISVIVIIGLFSFYATQFFKFNPFSSITHDIADFPRDLTTQKTYIDPLNVTRNLYYGINS